MKRIAIGLLFLLPGMIYAEMVEPTTNEFQPPADTIAQERVNTDAPPVETAASAPTESSSKTISLDLRGMDIGNVLKILSQKSGLKIITGKDVRGSVNLFIDNIDVMDALKIILESNDLAYEKEGDYIKIITGQEYERKYGRRFDDERELKIFPLKYVKPDEVASILGQLKSSAGQIIVNTKANSLIVIDQPEVLVKMEQIIADTDKNEQEVLIEAKILQIMLSDDYQIGVDWAQVFQNVSAIGENANGNVEIKMGSLIDKGAMGLRGQLQVGSLSGNNYSAILSALQTIGKTDLLSSPRIAVLNNKEARILVGTKEAYVTTTVVTSGSGVSTTAESITFIDVGIKLYVTPVISSDGFITLKIRPEVSSVYDTRVTATGNKIPLVRTSETETTITAKDGTTIIIAGLIEEKEVKTRNMVPFLGKLPLIGHLFGGISKTKAKTELAILMTPHIISGAEDYKSLTSADGRAR